MEHRITAAPAALAGAVSGTWSVQNKSRRRILVQRAIAQPAAGAGARVPPDGWVTVTLDANERIWVSGDDANGFAFFDEEAG